MSKITIAIIEDHDLTRIGLQTALKEYSNIELIGEASNGSDGIELLFTKQPDVAIVDIGLPDMDGIKLTEKIKTYLKSQEILTPKILILTLQDNEEVVIAAFAAGADSYCMKDISFELLMEAIKTTHEGNNWIDPAIARIVLSQAQKANSLSTDSHDKKVAINAINSEYNQLIESCPLTERELEVLQLIVDGCSNAEIAEKLYITVGTVKTHVRNILNKLCADDRTQAAVRALRTGLVG